MYARGQVRYGYVPNHTKLFGHRPGVWAGWEALLGSIRSNMDPRRYELYVPGTSGGTERFEYLPGIRPAGSHWTFYETWRSAER